MTTKNSDATRFFSRKQEESVAKALNATTTPNSGATLFSAGDVIQHDAKLLIECKTCVTDRDSFSIKQDWITKNKHEMKELRLDYSTVAFNFGPNKPNYYIIDEVLMKFLVDKLIEDNK